MAIFSFQKLEQPSIVFQEGLREKVSSPFEETLRDEVPAIFYLEHREISSSLRELVEMGIKVPRYEEIHDYLLLFPDTVDVLPKIGKSARAHFPTAELSLELYRDPEIEDEHLVLYVRLPEYKKEDVKNLLEEIHKVVRENKGIFVGKKGWLLFTTDFKPSR